MPLRLVLEPSRSLALFVYLVHGLAGLAALANSLPMWARLGLFAAVGYSAYRGIRAQRNPDISELNLDSAGGWRVIGRRGEMAARVAGSTVVTRWIVLLHLETEEAGKIALPICRDSTDPESFRRLRVALRCGSRS